MQTEVDGGYAAHELKTRAEAAEYIGVKPQTLAAWATHGRYDLPYIRVGRCVRYLRSDLDNFLRSRTVTNTGGASINLTRPREGRPP